MHCHTSELPLAQNRFGAANLRALTVAFFTLCVFPQAAFTASEEKLRVDHKIINWVPTDVETLVVATKPFIVKKYSETEPNLSLHCLTLARLLYQKSSLEGKTVLVAIEACRDFWYPGGNDTNIDEGCHIYLFRESINLSLNELPGKIVRLDGVDVVKDTVDVGAGSMESYLAQPTKNVLVLASSERYMRTILRRMKIKSSDRAMPESLPEWKYVSKNASFYALRHYDKTSQDPMSPYPKGSMWDAYGVADKEAIGFAVSSSSYTPSTLSFWYLSNNPAGVDTVAQMFSDDGARKDVTSKLVSNNCWKVEVSSKNRWHTLLQVMAMLGHTPYF